MANKRTSNWDQLQQRTYDDQMEYRDVYEDQQLERSAIQDKQTPTSRIVLTAITSLFAILFAWVIVSVICLGFGAVSNMMPSSNGTKSAQSQTLTGAELAKKYGIADRDVKVSMSAENSWTLQVRKGMKYEFYQITDPNAGKIDKTTIYSSAKDVPKPTWVKVHAKADAKPTLAKPASNVLVAELMRFSIFKLLFSLASGLVVFGMMYTVMMRNLAAQNMMNDTSDINQYHNDQHIALPEEVMRKFDWFPDAGAHTNVQPSSMVSHVMLQNKGINPVMVAKRAKKDIKSKDGEIEYLKGEIIRDDDENAIMEKKPMFDKDFAESLFDVSGLPKDKSLRKYYDATQIPYNPGNNNRDKQKGYNTVADLINGDWVIPEYETQRPAGAYLVDIDPVNTIKKYTWRDKYLAVC